MGSTVEHKIQDVACALILNGQSILAARRGDEMSNRGAWELPGGKPLPGETPEQCVIRRVHDELEINISIIEALPSYEVEYSEEKTFRMHPFIATIVDGKVMLKKTHQFVGWFSPLELVRLSWPASDLPVIDRVMSWALTNEYYKLA